MISSEHIIILEQNRNIGQGGTDYEQVKENTPQKPEVYMRVVADSLPKEANINVEAGEAFVELWRKISEGLGDELADRLGEAPSVLVHQ